MIRFYENKDLKDINEIGSLIKSNFNEVYNINNLNKGYSNILVYEINNKVVGFLQYEEHFEITDVINIAVSLESQNKGYGSDLLNYLISNTKSNKLMLEVRENNLKAINFYIKNGFTEINRRKKYYGDEDAIIMERSIK